MKRYFVLLKEINISGKNKLPAVDLSFLLENETLQVLKSKEFFNEILSYFNHLY